MRGFRLSVVSCTRNADSFDTSQSPIVPVRFAAEKKAERN